MKVQQRVVMTRLPQLLVKPEFSVILLCRKTLAILFLVGFFFFISFSLFFVFPSNKGLGKDGSIICGHASCVFAEIWFLTIGCEEIVCCGDRDGVFLDGGESILFGEMKMARSTCVN